MGTTYNIKLIVPSKEKISIQSIKQKIDKRLDLINNLMSTYIPQSELSRFNKLKNQNWFDIDPSTYKVIRASLDISKKSNGFYDITIGPLVNLWGFGPKNNKTEVQPNINLINKTLKNVGFKNIELRAHPQKKGKWQIRKKKKQIYLDLSSLAKGFAVDEVSDLLFLLKFSNHMVEIGGEIRVKGFNKSGNPWRIAIEYPHLGRILPKRSIAKILDLKNISMATSGDYRNYFKQDNTVFSHTINPQTGKPIYHNLTSVTVIHSSCMQADAWATALLALGPEKGYRIAQKNKLKAMFIIRKDHWRNRKKYRDFFDTKATSYFEEEYGL